MRFKDVKVDVRVRVKGERGTARILYKIQPFLNTGAVRLDNSIGGFITWHYLDLTKCRKQ